MHASMQNGANHPSSSFVARRKLDPKIDPLAAGDAFFDVCTLFL